MGGVGVSRGSNDIIICSTAGSLLYFIPMRGCHISSKMYHKPAIRKKTEPPDEQAKKSHAAEPGRYLPRIYSDPSTHPPPDRGTTAAT